MAGLMLQGAGIGQTIGPMVVSFAAIGLVSAWLLRTRT